MKSSNFISSHKTELSCIDNKCTRGGNVIAMDPKTGDILAMATYPDYNLNTPFEPYSDELSAIWDTLSSQEKSTKLGEVYKNRAVSDGYEPGSTFKLASLLALLEKGKSDTARIYDTYDGVVKFYNVDLRQK